MPQERTEAVVLRAVDFSETSRIVTFLTPERGRLACMAAGSRRPKTAMAGLLDTFNRLEIVYYWKAGRNVQRLAEVTLLDGYAPIKGDLDRAMLGAFPLELAYKVGNEDEPSEELYAALVRGLDGLAAWDGDPMTHTAWHALQLVSAAGFAPAVDTCALCGTGVDPKGSPVGFAYEGGVTCPACRGDRVLSREAYGTLRVMAAAGGACPLREGSAEVFKIVCEYAKQQIETDFRSLRVIREVCGS